MTQAHQPHISDEKKAVVAELKTLINQYPIVGAVNMDGLPARQLQIMREQLRDTCVILMTKRRLIKVALEESGQEGIVELGPHLKGMPALLFTKENPFTLFKTLKKNKSPAPAKGGQIAPSDIKVPAGKTPFAPGPIIGELGKFGLKTGVDGGKVAVKEEKIVCKEGEVISPALAGLLTRLQIYPMEVGLSLTAVYEDGEIIGKSVLDIDEEQYLADIMSAAAGAFNLGVNAGVYNETTTPVILTNAITQARNLSVESVWITDDNAAIILGRAQAHLAAVASHLPEELRPEGLAVAQEAAPAAAVESSEPEPDKKDDEEEETEAAAGLGALFG